MSAEAEARAPRWPALLGWAVALALAGVVCWRVDVRAVGARLGALDARWLAAFLLLSLPLYLLEAWRWRFTAARVGAPLGFGRALAEYYVSTLLNQVLPFGVAGDVARAARQRARLGPGSGAAAAAGVVLERLSGVAALMLCVAGSGVVWWLRGRGQARPDSLVERPLAMLALALAALAALGGGAWLLARRASATGVRAMARRALWADGALAFQLAVSLGIMLLVIARYVCAGRAAAVALAPLEALQLVPLLLAAMMVPWAFSGWGVREAVLAGLFTLAGLDGADGVALGVAYGGLSLVAAAPGFVVLLWPVRA